MKAYADTSLLSALFIPDALSARAELLLVASAPSLLVSNFAVAEFFSALSRRVRMRELTLAQAKHLAGEFDMWLAAVPRLVWIEAADMSLATAYLRRFDLRLRTPDAIHVAAAYRLEATLATLDASMATDAATLGLSVLT